MHELQEKKTVAELFKQHARVYIKVYGRVQGVFYRDQAKKTADELGITGWVKNSGDGAVEITAEGDKPVLRQFIVHCRKGSPLSKVEKLDYNWEEYTGKFKEFYIRY